MYYAKRFDVMMNKCPKLIALIGYLGTAALTRFV